MTRRIRLPERRINAFDGSTDSPMMDLRDPKVARLPDPNEYEPLDVTDRDADSTDTDALMALVNPGMDLREHDNVMPGMDLSDRKIANLPDPNENIMPTMDLRDPPPDELKVNVADDGSTGTQIDDRDPAFRDDKHGITTEGWGVGPERFVSRQTKAGMVKMPRDVYEGDVTSGKDPFARFNEGTPPEDISKVGRFAQYDKEAGGPSFDASKNYFPAKKADPSAVVARAKKLAGSGNDLSPTPDRPQFGPIPEVADAKADAKPNTGRSAVEQAIANMVMGAKPAGKDAELEKAREEADLNTFAADLREAGSEIGHAGRRGFDASKFDKDRVNAQLPLNRLKEDRANAATANTARIAGEDRLINLEAKLRSQGREAEADKLKAEIERGKAKHDVDALSETSRHNKAMEAIARAKGHGGAGGGKGGSLSPSAQQRADSLGSIDLDLKRLHGLVFKPDGTPKSDIPGAGVLDGSKFAQPFNSTDDDAVQQSVLNIVSNLAQMRSGKAVAEPEFKRIMRSYGMDTGGVVGNREQAFASGLKKFEEDVNLLRNGQMPQNPGAWPSHMLVGHVGQQQVQAPANQGVQTAGAVAEPKSEQEYNALPPGTIYVKDGVKHRKQ